MYYGASVEGAVILVNAGEEGKQSFLSNYENVVRHRMIWVYILAYHQRIALISAASDTTQLFEGGNEPTTQAISKLVERLSRIQLRCLFQEVSHYTQQNDFYYLCRDNLRVPELFEEVKSEINELEQIVNEKRRTEEVERKTKEDRLIKRRTRQLELLLAVLIFPQIWIAILSTEYERFNKWINAPELVNYIQGVSISIIIIVVIILFKTFYPSKRNK